MSAQPSAVSIAALRAAGLTYADIGRAVGRDKSLIRQIETGRKPGENLRDALADVQTRLAAIPAKNARQAAREAAPVVVARRTSASGREARVRRPVTVSGRSWQTSVLRRQASLGGAGGMLSPLRRAAADDREIAVTVTFAADVYVDSGSGKRTTPGRGGSVEMKLGQAEDVLDALDASGQTFADYIAQAAHEAGYIGQADAGIEQIEMRAW